MMNNKRPSEYQLELNPINPIQLINLKKSHTDVQHANTKSSSKNTKTKDSFQDGLLGIQFIAKFPRGVITTPDATD